MYQIPRICKIRFLYDQVSCEFGMMNTVDVVFPTKKSPVELNI